MTIKLSGKDGVLRIYDSAAVLHSVAPRDDATPDMVHFDGASTWTDLTTYLQTDDTNYVNPILNDTDDVIYIGSDIPFCMVQYIKGGSNSYAAGSGDLIRYYFNGTNFDTALPGVVDGTNDGTDCFAQDGYITFHAPRDWAVGANAYNANLDSDKYYIALMLTSSSTDPCADVLCPVDGQYFEIAFASMDFNGPIGRPPVPETLVLERGNANSKMHFIENSDSGIFEPVPISFSCAIDDTYNKDDIFVVLEGGNPASDRWTAAGTTAKGTTKNDGTTANPSFADSGKKALNVMIRFAGSSFNFGMAYYETFFPEGQQTIQESEEGVILTCNGGVYGVIERIFHFGNRY